MKAEKLCCEGAKGKLALTLYRPEGAKDVVILAHGFMASQRFTLIRKLATALCEEGLAVVTYDFNGHGRSEGRFQDMTVLNELEDARCVYRLVRSWDWVDTIALGGHSQGGVVSGLLAGELGYPAIRALLQMAPAAVLHDDALQGRIMNAHYDPEHVPEYVRVFLVKKVGRAYFEVAKMLDIYGLSGQYEGPVCLIHGDQDTVVPLRYSEQYAATYAQAELHVLQGEDHMMRHQAAEIIRLACDFLKK